MFTMRDKFSPFDFEARHIIVRDTDHPRFVKHVQCTLEEKESHWLFWTKRKPAWNGDLFFEAYGELRVDISCELMSYHRWLCPITGAWYGSRIDGWLDSITNTLEYPERLRQQKIDNLASLYHFKKEG